MPVAPAAIAFLPVVMLLGWRQRQFADLSFLAGTKAFATLANSFICRTLSNAHDRYGARLMWIAPLGVALVALRRRHPIMTSSAE